MAIQWCANILVSKNDQRSQSLHARNKFQGLYLCVHSVVEGACNCSKNWTAGNTGPGFLCVVVSFFTSSLPFTRSKYKPPWQTETIQYRRRMTGRLEWPGGLCKFWSSSLPHQRGRALALWRLNRAWLDMSKFGYLKKKQEKFKLSMLFLFIYLLIYYIWALVDIRYKILYPY